MKLKNLGLVGIGMVAGIAVSVQFSAFAQKGGPAMLPLEELRQLADVYTLIQTDYVEKVDGGKLLSDAIGGMVASLDPHSVYLDKEAFREMRESVEGKFVGVGIEVASEDGYVKIVAPMEDSPAWRAGVKAGDLITRVDDTPVRGLSLDDAIERMRGEPGSRVTLTIARRGTEKPLPFTLVREEINVKSVKAAFVEPGYAWVRVAQFQDDTLTELAKKLRELYARDSAIKGLVLDLRNDPGGLLPGAIGVTAAFLPKNQPIVSTVGQVADSNQVFYGRKEYYVEPGEEDPLARLPGQLKTVPLVVLVNAGSASASEIVAGALQDYKRAVVMGSQTFGKGSVQTLRQLTEDTALKLTTARYYTPKGRSIQAHGIVPDLPVDETAEGDTVDALLMREADLERHLANKSSPESARQVRDPEEEQRALALLREREQFEYGSAQDFQLAQAIRHFKGLPVQLSKPAARATVAAAPAAAVK
ncbi:S41 family peptidase [Pseudoduganella sp. GCM10020061]|uniref:S41 family peptidase n=1 Tax=Pseudoduganella sp. GCM10020061 TaxID=3317345 RepID=UPI003625F28C